MGDKRGACCPCIASCCGQGARPEAGLWSHLDPGLTKAMASVNSSPRRGQRSWEAHGREASWGTLSMTGTLSTPARHGGTDLRPRFSRGSQQMLPQTRLGNWILFHRPHCLLGHRKALRSMLGVKVWVEPGPLGQ